MATEKVNNAKFVSKRSRWQLGIRAIVVATVLATIAVFIGKDISRSVFTEQFRQLPIFPTVRSDNASQNLSSTDLLPPDVENVIRQSILKRLDENDGWCASPERLNNRREGEGTPRNSGENAVGNSGDRAL